MPDQHRRERQSGADALDVGDIVVEARDEQRIAAAARARAAQAERVGGGAARGKPRQEVRLPSPCVAIPAVHEQQRRLAAGSGGQP
jgi:hypothetical protein